MDFTPSEITLLKLIQAASEEITALRQEVRILSEHIVTTAEFAIDLKADVEGLRLRPNHVVDTDGVILAEVQKTLAYAEETRDMLREHIETERNGQVVNNINARNALNEFLAAQDKSNPYKGL